jgi:hypothetical protein
MVRASPEVVRASFAELVSSDANSAKDVSGFMTRAGRGAPVVTLTPRWIYLRISNQKAGRYEQASLQAI